MRALALDSTTLAISQASTPSTARGRLWTGRVLSGIAALFLTFDGLMKVLAVAPVVKATHELGYPISSIVPIGLILLGCVALYLVPRTAPLGAVLLTGFLGGAIATNVRMGNPLFSHTLFPIYVAALLWGGLYLRDRRVSQLLRADRR